MEERKEANGIAARERDCPAPVGKVGDRRARFIRLAYAVWATAARLIVAGAAAVLLAAAVPVLRIQGSSMAPTLESGQVVVCTRLGAISPGDIVAFYYQNQILIKRVAASGGQWGDIAEDGTVLVDGVPAAEPEGVPPARGGRTAELPCQVPEGQWFVLGDDREHAADSRDSAVGCVEKDRLIGKVILRLWPLDRLRWLG